MREVRILSSRAPYRRAGLAFASVREPMVVALVALTAVQLVALCRDPALKVEVNVAGDWLSTADLGCHDDAELEKLFQQLLDEAAEEVTGSTEQQVTALSIGGQQVDITPGSLTIEIGTSTTSPESASPAAADATAPVSAAAAPVSAAAAPVEAAKAETPKPSRRSGGAKK